MKLITSSASQNVIGLGSDLRYLDCKFCNGRNELFCLVRAFIFSMLCWHPNIKVFNSQHVSQKMTVKASLSLLNRSNCLSIVISQCLNANGVHVSMSHWKAAIMLHKLHRAHSVARWNPIVCQIKNTCLHKFRLHGVSVVYSFSIINTIPQQSQYCVFSIRLHPKIPLSCKWILAVHAKCCKGHATFSGELFYLF